MFKSLHHILDVIENQPGWEVQHQFRLILTHWSGVVGATVADHTRPTGIDRSVLWVATSSSIWAQELTFKRQLILQKLNERLGNKTIGDPLANSLNSDLTNQNDRLLSMPKKSPLPNTSGYPLPMKSIAIKDIRFSPGQWRPRFDDASPIAKNHPSYLPPRIKPRLDSSLSVKNISPNPEHIHTQAFSSLNQPDKVIKSDNSDQSSQASLTTQTWWQEVQARSLNLPLCSQCYCPTPPGEIDRWNCCALCATKKWSR